MRWRGSSWGTLSLGRGASFEGGAKEDGWLVEPSPTSVRAVMVSSSGSGSKEPSPRGGISDEM